MRFSTGCAALLALAALFMGCSTQVRYGDPQAPEVLTIDFGSTDLQGIASKMIDGLLSAPVLRTQPPSVVFFAGVRNKTDEHVDTKNITDQIRTRLIQSGRVVFTDRGETDETTRKELDYQNNSGMVGSADAKQPGRQVAPDYYLFGELTSIRKRSGSSENLYFKFTLNLKNIERGTLDWAEEKEIRKDARRRFLGL